MRLIHAKTLKLEEFIGNIPPYAILSHTWGSEEVTFEEFQAGADSGRAGYRKILKACVQAEEDGFQYVWIDTCCINKSSSAELSESINSMFRWYQDATVCYTYLEDTQGTKDFSDARWFTRGWTLQELLAPKAIKFYNCQWCHIGTRESLADEIESVTSISSEALRGAESLGYVRRASIAMKMAWAARRVTTREEDTAYCLLGLFDVNMPLLYGEGGIKAFERLQEEIIKGTLDNSFLAWHLFRSRPARGQKDMKLLAGHPNFFKDCNGVFITDEDVASFSLNNQGLQIKIPISQVPGRRNHYFAVLTCVHEPYKGAIFSSIRIPLRSVERSGRTFICEEPDSLNTFREEESLAACLKDICILRIPPRPKRKMLWIKTTRENSINGYHWEETLFMDESGRWQYQKSTGQFIELEPISTLRRIRTYGVVFTRSFGRLDDGPKILIRVDLSAESSYSANVSIDQFAGVMYSNDLSNVPNTAKSSKDCKSMHQSIKLRFEQPDTMTASISWDGSSGQDVLVLDVKAVNTTLIGRLEAYLLFLYTKPPITKLVACYVAFIGIVASLQSYTQSGYLIRVTTAVGFVVIGHLIGHNLSPRHIKRRVGSVLKPALCSLALGAMGIHSIISITMIASWSFYGMYSEVYLVTPVILGIAFLQGSLGSWMFAIWSTLGLQVLWAVWKHYGVRSLIR